MPDEIRQSVYGIWLEHSSIAVMAEVAEIQLK